MPTRSAILVNADDAVTLGNVVELPASLLRTLAPKLANGRGIVLADDRVEIMVPMTVDGKDDVMVKFVASIYIQRGAITDIEAKEVDKLSTEQKAKKTAREVADDERLAKEKRAAFEMGQSGAFSSMRHIGEIAQAARIIEKIQS